MQAKWVLQRQRWLVDYLHVEPSERLLLRLCPQVTVAATWG